MPVKIDPLKINGKWAEGYAMDLHTVESTFLGYNAYGHPDFKSTRSDVGELVYKLKYGANAEAVETLADTAVEFLKKWGIKVDLVPPVRIAPSVAFDGRNLSDRGNSSGQFLRVLITNFRLLPIRTDRHSICLEAKTQIQRQVASFSDNWPNCKTQELKCEHNSEDPHGYAIK